MNYQEQILANKAVWEQRAALHPETEFYQQDAFMQGQTSLQSIERSLLATDLSGKRVLHLQCHFGQDSLSLARMGAEVVGLDLSETAIAKAQSLAKALNLNARFYQGNVLDAQEVLAQEAPFDLIFCSYGVVYWLPDLLQWGQEIGPLLKRGENLCWSSFTLSSGCLMTTLAISNIATLTRALLKPKKRAAMPTEKPRS